MSQNTPWPDALGLPIASNFLLPSPVMEDGTPRERGKLLELMFLSANFSTESFQNDLDPLTPNRSVHVPGSTDSSFANNLTPGLYSKRLNGSVGSLHNSPAAPVGQQSFSYHQRTGSNPAQARPRPRSILGAEGMDYAIWEHEGDSAVPLETPRNRNSYHFSSRANYAPVNLPPPTEPRKARSRSGSPSRSSSPIRKLNTSPYRQRASSPSKQPFNFQPQDIMTHSNGSNLSLVVKPAHRKGHRYKHSSVSMNLFQEPVPIADANQQPNLIPDSYPIPNVREAVNSATPTQRYKFSLAITHFITSMVVFVYGVRYHQSAFSTLAHLVFYDSLGSLVVACVDVISNFEVWYKPSIAYPFGLARLEVLTGFALCTSLVMVGCDLISHFVEEMIVGYVDASVGESAEHGSHHIHHHSGGGDMNWVLYELILIFVFLITWFTSVFIFDEGSISDMLNNNEQKLVKGMFLGSQKREKDGLLDAANEAPLALLTTVKAFLRTLIKNPIRMLTLFYSAFLLAVPLIPSLLKLSFGYDLNEASTFVVAATLCYAGWNLVISLGGILLVSFPYSDYDYNVLKATIQDKVLGLPSFKASYSVGSIHMTKVNHKIYIVGMEASMRGGSADDESRLIFEINRIVANVVNDFDSGCTVETTINMSRA